MQEWWLSKTGQVAQTRLEYSDSDFGELNENVVDGKLSPEEFIIRKEQYLAIIKAIQALDQNEKILFYRKYYYSQPISQIAAELGMSERAVEGKIYRLKKRLRKTLGGENYEF